jgi:hypothetical protein
MKSKTAKDAAFAVLSSCALKYGQLEAIAGSTIAALTRNEHLAATLAELAEYAENKCDDNRLVRGLPCRTMQQVPCAADLLQATMSRECKPSCCDASLHHAALASLCDGA